MKPQRITVFFPCHSLGDFPTWLDEREADDLLTAWTAAWHPRILAALGRTPEWASVDMPPADLTATIGIVPTSGADRFAAHVDAAGAGGAHLVRGVSGREAIVAAALEPCAAEAIADAAIADVASDFHALGLAWLLAELLARRMRSETGLESSGFEQTAVAAAQAACDGDSAAARSQLAECFAALEAARSHYYPVDVWLLDLVLLAPTTLGAALERELRCTVPQALVATAAVIASLAERNPEAMRVVRDRVADGSLAPVGGRHDDRPLDLLTIAGIERSLDRGMATWQEHAGRPPATFGQIAGGSSAVLPRLLAARGFSGAIWNLFDGTRLPDPGASRILWEGTGHATIDAVARPPLDARRAGTFLSLAETIGNAMDHDHTVVVPFAHYPGTASRWHDDFRRIAGWSKAFGSFVTPDELFRRTSGTGTRVDFAADAYPVTLPRDDIPIRDQVAAEAAAARADAASSLPASAPRCRPADPDTIAPAPRPGSLARAFGRLMGRPVEAADLVLDNGVIRVKLHEATGGLLALRVPGDAGNRISQRLALRTTRPPPAAGKPWEDVGERAEYSGMVADAITRAGGTIRSCGRLTQADGADVGTFVQRASLVAGLPLVLLDVEIRLAKPLSPPALESYATCRFAWHENEMPDVMRSLHLEPVITERSRFTSPHFIEVQPASGRRARPALQIFTLGLPWHVRSGEHIIDSILPADAGEAISCRLAVGVGIERPGELAIDLMAART